MNGMRRTLRRATIYGVVALCCGTPVARAEVADQLERPAVLSPRALHLGAVAVARADRRLVAVGERGTILLSDDGGLAWRQAKFVPVSLTLTGVHFVDDKQGWAVGNSGVVLHSGDGGETWEKQLDGGQAAQIELAAAQASANDNDSASSLRLREAERLVHDGPDKPFLDAWFEGQEHGVIVGAYGLIFATYDGGKTWQSLMGSLNNPRGKHIYAVRRFGNRWLLAGEQGALFRSDDEAHSFEEIETPYAGTYFGVLAGNHGELLVYGLRGNAYWSGDDGTNWSQVDTGSPTTLPAGTRLADGSLVLVDETGQVLRSFDGGRSFVPVPVPMPAPFTGVAESPDGTLVASSMRGMIRIAFGDGEQVQGGEGKGQP